MTAEPPPTPDDAAPTAPTPTADAPDRLVVYASAAGQVLPLLIRALAVAILAVAGTAFIIIEHWAEAIIACLGAVLAIVTLVGKARPVMRHEPRLIIDAGGVDDRRSGYGLVPWEDITSIRLRQTDGRDYITFTVSYLEKYLDRLPTHRRTSVWLWNFMGVEEIHISATGLQVNTEDIWNHVVNVIQPVSLGQTGGTDAAEDGDPTAALGDGRGDR